MVALRKTKGNMQNDEEVAARLLVLATAPDRRSKSGRLRTLLPAIETAIQAGLSLEVILAELNSQGLNMNIGSFKSTLYRIRRKKPPETPMPAATLPASSTPKREVSGVPVEQRAEEASEAIEDSERLTARQRREKIADQFITPQSSNPLLNKFIKKENKQ